MAVNSGCGTRQVKTVIASDLVTPPMAIWGMVPYWLSSSVRLGVPEWAWKDRGKPSLSGICPWDTLLSSALGKCGLWALCWSHRWSDEESKHLFAFLRSHYAALNTMSLGCYCISGCYVSSHVTTAIIVLSASLKFTLKIWHWIFIAPLFLLPLTSDTCQVEKVPPYSKTSSVEIGGVGGGGRGRKCCGRGQVHISRHSTLTLVLGTSGRPAAAAVHHT